MDRAGDYRHVITDHTRLIPVINASLLRPVVKANVHQDGGQRQ